MAENIMYKVIKGFILANGFEGKVSETVSENEFSKKEIASLTKDGSIKSEKKVSEKPKKKTK